MSKILHGGRLSSVREDVAKFTSSRKDDERLAYAVVDINKAHVVMLIEQKIIQPQDGAKILKALQKLSNVQLDPAAEDVHMAVEEAVLKETGPEVGGNLHIAKSRNDQVTTAIRMQLRNELVVLMLQVLADAGKPSGNRELNMSTRLFWSTLTCRQRSPSRSPITCCPTFKL